MELSAGIKISRILARTADMRGGERHGRGQRLGRKWWDEESEDEKEMRGLPAAAAAEEDVAKGSAIDGRLSGRETRMEWKQSDERRRGRLAC